MFERNMLKLLLATNGALVLTLVASHSLFLSSDPGVPGSANPVSLTELAMLSEPEKTQVRQGAGNDLQCGWQDVMRSKYEAYVERLRLAGCPPEGVELIVVMDVNRFFAQRRLEAARAHDTRYWDPHPIVTSLDLLYEIGLKMDDDRESRLQELLGSDYHVPVARTELWRNAWLTGEELGGLTRERHHEVEATWEKVKRRHSAYYEDRTRNGDPILEIAVARLRADAREQMRPLLEPAQFRAFLLRHSHNAELLRLELSPFNPTREEFDRIFDEIDPIDLAMQREFGGLSSMSERQRQRWRMQREQIMRDVLGRDRYRPGKQA